MIRTKLKNSFWLDNNKTAKPRLALAKSAERFALESFGLTAADITGRKTFHSLGIDSLDKLKLAMDFEKKYKIRLADSAVADTESIEEVAALVAKTATDDAASF